MHGAVALAKQLQVSSRMCCNPRQTPEAQQWQSAGLMLRQGVQFHWRNHGYRTFDDLLASMTHDKRKRIRQDRRYDARGGRSLARQPGVRHQCRRLGVLHRCYESTYTAHHSNTVSVG